MSAGRVWRENGVEIAVTPHTERLGAVQMSIRLQDRELALAFDSKVREWLICALQELGTEESEK